MALKMAEITANVNLRKNVMTTAIWKLNSHQIF